jgi:pimeloyl-ACP methyl ester carboxylesterase
MSCKRHGTRFGWRARSLVVVMMVLAAPVTGCATLQYALTSRGQVRSLLQLGRIEGRIDSAAPADGPLVVVLTESRWGLDFDTYVRPGPGRFAFTVTPGRYNLSAYEDRNKSGRMDPGEPTWRGAPPLDVGPAQAKRQDIVLDSHATARRGEVPIEASHLVAEAPREEVAFSPWARSAQGTVCPDLRDERFGPEAAQRGVWRPMEFLHEGLAGVYFLEPYDSDRIPVLFVHGFGGSPRNFSSFAGSLDAERFQPWFYFYPSGAPLDGASEHLARVLAQLEVTHGFEELAIVGHSIGGLVARGASLEHQPMEVDPLRLFITLATPWGGIERARALPIPLMPALEDMAPSSDFLRRLFHTDDGRMRRFPDEVSFHLVMGFRMKVLATIANDGSVSVASQARLEAQNQAVSVRALDVDHEDILISPDAIGRVNELLAERFRQQGEDWATELR